MFHSFFLFFILFTAPSSYSTLLKAPQTPLEEFSAYVQTESAVSYAQRQFEQIQTQPDDIKKLRLMLEQAQRSFLKDHLHQSGDYFRSIVKMAHQKDWAAEAQKIIFYSFLRLAQIEWKGLEAEALLYSASVLAPQLEPDVQLFPPPLIQKFNAIRKKQAKLSVSLKRIFPFHEIILINGRVFSNKVRLPYGEYRVTALSSSHRKWSRIISLSQLVQKRIVTAPLVSGSCRHPVFSKGIKHSPVLFPNFCLWTKSLKKSAPTSASEEFYTSSEIQKNAEDLKTSIKWKEHKKWGAFAAAAVGVAAVGFLLWRNQKSSQKNPVKQPPKLKKGF